MEATMTTITHPSQVRRCWKFYAQWRTDDAMVERTIWARDMADAEQLARQYAPKVYRSHLLTLDEVGPFPQPEHLQHP